MLRTLAGAAALAMVAALVPGAVMAPASAAPVPPTVTLAMWFPVGGHVKYTGDYWDVGQGYTDIPLAFSWTTSASPNQVTVYAESDAAPPHELISGASPGSFTRTISDWDAEGGCSPCVFGGYGVLAYDPTGSVYTARALGSMPTVTQENGQTAGLPVGAVSFRGRWSVSAGAWAGGGQQRYAKDKGAWVKYTQTFVAGGGIIGVIMAKGPKRGSATVRVDGTKVATVNTHADANDNQVIVWSGRVGAGPHTVKVVNRSTKGHGRIDIDAFVTMNLRPTVPSDLPCGEDCT